MNALETLFNERFADVRGRGIDRVGSDRLRRRLGAELAGMNARALNGSYRFSPYLERLVSKGPRELPRQLSVPTVRDRLILHQLKEYLHAHVPTSVSRMLPNEYVREIKAVLTRELVERLSIVRLDIRRFYDTIPHRLLIPRLEQAIPDVRVQVLLRRAVRTPTDSIDSHRPRGGRKRNSVGVPQGLAVSNALASEFLSSLDERWQRECLLYLRYVDDILLIVPREQAEKCRKALEGDLSLLELEVNPLKSVTVSATQEFGYLGYLFHWPKVGVRRATIERYLRKMAKVITRYRRSTERSAGGSREERERRQAMLIEDLNERITGAISGGRRYGWLFYFIELTDRSLLHSMDNSIRRLIQQVPAFRDHTPQGLKRMARAHFEAMHTPSAGYIHDYNALRTTEQQLDFLVRRGRVDPELAAQLTSAQVTAYFQAYRKERLQDLELDVGFLS